MDCQTWIISTPHLLVPPTTNGLPKEAKTQAITYAGSVFIPGRVRSRGLNLLIDTGCTHNLLLRTVYNRLPLQQQQQMVQKKTMADGSSLYIFKSICLDGRLKKYLFEAWLFGLPHLGWCYYGVPQSPGLHGGMQQRIAIYGRRHPLMHK